jgi:hypothetical protein
MTRAAVCLISGSAAAAPVRGRRGDRSVRLCRANQSIVAGTARTTVPAAREMRGNGRKAVI